VHLPRIEVVVDLENKSCPCCGGELHRIGEDRSERLDMVPAQFVPRTGDTQIFLLYDPNGVGVELKFPKT
jgi:transposase